MKRLFILALSLAACATPWMPAEGTYAQPAAHYSVQLPQGWMRLRDAPELFTTRDGPLLQRVFAKWATFGQPLPASKKVITAGMLPEEAAEVVRDELATSGGAQGLTVAENAPAQVAGKPGFRIVYRFRTGDGLQMKGVAYGVMGNGGLAMVAYVAAERHYFDLDLPTFEQIRESMRLQ
jgi:hypothetical protein